MTVSAISTAQTIAAYGLVGYAARGNQAGVQAAIEQSGVLDVATAREAIEVAASQINSSVEDACAYRACASRVLAAAHLQMKPQEFAGFVFGMLDDTGSTKKPNRAAYLESKIKSFGLKRPVREENPTAEPAAAA